MSPDQQVIHLKHKEGSDVSTKYLAIASGKGGVGKTLLSLSVGKALADSGKKVLIIDADFGLSNVHLMLGINPPKNLADFLFGKATFQDIVVSVTDRFSFISSGSGIQELARLPKDQVMNLVRRLQELAEDNYDFVVFDTPPGIHDDTLSVVSAVDVPIILTTPEPTAVADAYALIKIVSRETQGKDFFLVVNKVESEKEGTKVYESIKLLADRYTKANVIYAGAIKFRKGILRRIIEQSPFDGAFMDDVYNILSKLDLEIPRRKRSFWEAVVSRILGRK